MKKTLVIGGTRGTGLLVAKLLHSRGYSVRVFARNPVAATKRLGTTFDIVSGDITVASTIPPALEDVDHDGCDPCNKTAVPSAAA